MKHTFGKHAKLAGITLAAVAAFAAFGTGTVQAATFASADLSLNSFGFLNCSFKETGLAAGAEVNYMCGAEAVGWVTECFVKNKPIGGSAPMLHVGKNVTTQQTLFATNRGTLTGTILTAYPTVEEEFEPAPCPHVVGGPGKAEVEVEETITAIRWCNATLADTTNNIVGATASELLLQMERNGNGTVPACDVLLASPPIP